MIRKIFVWINTNYSQEKSALTCNLLDSPVRLLLFTTVPLPATVKAFKLTLYIEYGSRKRIENIYECGITFYLER